MTACPAILPGDAFLSGLLGYVDCQAQTIGAAGYRALATPGTAVSQILGAMLTIFVALYGYRMLLGQVPALRDGVLAVVKIGMVLVLATSWPAFRTLAYDVTMRGPAELAASIGGGAGLPGADGGLAPRLQRIDNGLVELIELGTGKPDNADEVVGPSAVPLTPEQQQEQLARLRQLSERPRWDRDKEASRVASARTIYLTGTIAAFASVRLIAGLLLALGPLFALFLLFDATRGLFEGWVRGLAGAALGALSTAIVLGVELALIEPWLAGVLFQRREGVPMPSVPVELLVMSLVFALTLLAALIATAKVARGFRIPDALRILPAHLGGGAVETRLPATPVASAVPTAQADQRSRAHAVADAVAATQRRETATAVRDTVANGAGAGGTRAGGIQAAARDGAGGGAVPVGRSYRRRTGSRVSARAGRRDRTS